jgi:hypothetical protein
MLPSGLLLFSATDRTRIILQPFFRRITLTQAAAALGVFIPVEPRRVLCIQRIVVFVVPGAAQTIISFGAQVNDIAGTPTQALLFDRRENLPAAGLGATVQDSFPELAIPANYRIDATATFSAGGAANFLALDIAGFTMPAGNFVP